MSERFWRDQLSQTLTEGVAIVRERDTLREQLADHTVTIGILRRQLSEARDERDQLKAVVAKDRITTSGDNEITAYPWWAIIRPKQRGTAAMGAGPFFSRASAEEYLTGHRYRYGENAFVYCFSGHDAPDYRERIDAGKAPAALDKVIRMPLDERFNNSEVSRHLREHGYTVEFGSARKRAFVVSWGNPRSGADSKVGT